MELQQLKYFKAVASIGKISDAAESLFISAPALSTSISRLEKELGMPLFDRTSNKITLNTQGQIFLKYVDKVFANLESARQELRSSIEHHGPHISLLIISSPIWANVIGSFTAEFPQYTLSCSSTTIGKFAEKGLAPQYNFLLACQHEVPPAYAEKLNSSFLFQLKPTVIIHKDHPLAKRDILDVRELVNERLFLSTPGAPVHSRITQLFQLHGLPLPTDTIDSYVVRQKMVAENKGISFSSQQSSHNIHPNICTIPLADPFDPWKACIYWRTDRSLSPEESTFLEFTQQLYKDMH
jgi:DNA-binding transcriptional LysR family regulator